MDILTTLFSSKTKAQLVALLFSEELPEFYLRQLERQTGLEFKALHTELKKLMDIDLVEKRKDGNRIYFKAKSTHPLCAALMELVKKTVGIEESLRQLLADRKDIQIAFIFGSYAKGDFKAHSDIDLFCIGTISSMQMSNLIYDLQAKSGREINYHLYDEKEARKAIAEKKHFIMALKTTPKNFIRGEESEFKQLFAKKRD